MYQMRRADREVTGQAEITAILAACDTCRLGLYDGQQPYVVPLSFGFSWENDILTLYFHCAPKGRKLGILRQTPAACFEVSRPLGLIPGETACRWGTGFESVIGWGKGEVLEDTKAKEAALAHLMRHYAGDSFGGFEPQALAGTTVLALRADTLTAKRRPLPTE